MIDISPACEALLGYSREEALQTEVTAFYMLPQDRESFVQKMLRDKQVRDFELQMKHKAGHRVDIVVLP